MEFFILAAIGAAILFMVSLAMKKKRVERRKETLKKRKRGIGKREKSQIAVSVLAVAGVLIAGFSIASREWLVLAILGAAILAASSRIRLVVFGLVGGAARLVGRLLFGWERRAIQGMSRGQLFVLVLVLGTVIALLLAQAMIDAIFTP